MNRPWLIWLLSLCCAAGIFGAMGVITHRSLSMEQEGAQARADAELQERLRLALWRMETEASALMIEENNRPPEHFRAGTKEKPSPLSVALPKHVRLHFAVRTDGVVLSPQVPEAGDARFQEAEQNLKQLRTLLARSPSTTWCRSVVQTETRPASQSETKAMPSQGSKPGGWGNRVFLDAAAKNKGPFEQTPVFGQVESANGLTQNGGNLQVNAFNTKLAEAESAKQSISNVAEASQRAKVYANSAGRNTYNAQQSGTISLPPVSSKDLQAAASRAAVQAVRGGDGPRSDGLQVRPEIPQAAAHAPVAPATSTSPAEAPQQGVTPFRPFWLENELFLVREVTEAGKRHVQGVWLDAASLKAWLLEAILDILPQATLQAVASVEFVPVSAGQLLPAPAAGAGDPMDLVGLPWKLVPGERAIAIVRGWTPMRLTLAAAWMGALLAALAAAALLFGVTRLSERRAAFVSSVTHELRTPLTTFRLYSELLEQGMVREEADRTQYLHTLRTEAERLTHLVDNVLAYSRIERTNRRSRMESLDLGCWLERIRPRLEDRTRDAGMKLEMRIVPDSELTSVTDATALEQIVFNLVDNACKYAAGRCAEPVVRVALERRGRWAELRVCDTGPGIPRGERSRLFRPFHKSADEAANSKPGVGLGLALCHRLAKALGGKLTLEKSREQAAGACFVLRLPVA